MTPERAQAQIAQAIEAEPAPAAHDNLTPPTRLRRWYTGMKTKLRDAVKQARDYFTSTTEDSATAAGWQPDQLAEAGLEGRRSDDWRERQRQDRERTERAEQERQRQRQLEQDRIQAAERLSNEHSRVIMPDEVRQDPRTGEWRYEPHRPPAGDPSPGVDFDPDDAPRGPRPG